MANSPITSKLPLKQTLPVQTKPAVGGFLKNSAAQEKIQHLVDKVSETVPMTSFLSMAMGLMLTGLGLSVAPTNVSVSFPVPTINLSQPLPSISKAPSNPGAAADVESAPSEVQI